MHTARTPGHQMAGLEWALLLILSVLWGGSFFLVEVAVKELPPLTIVVTRVTLGAGTLLVVGRLMVQLEQGTPSVGSTLTLTSRLTPPRGIRRLGVSSPRPSASSSWLWDRPGLRTSASTLQSARSPGPSTPNSTSAGGHPTLGRSLREVSGRRTAAAGPHDGNTER